MRYQNVCLEAITYTLPEEIVSSEEIESRLAPLYQRLRLAQGRLELMSGIAQRRFWRRDARVGRISIETAEKAIQTAGVARSSIGALVHGSVCRDYLEPATACGVHQGLGLSPDCAVFDVSNACLGLLTGVIQVANMIELGQISAGLVVGTESGRGLVENTIERLNADESLTRRSIKPAIASLTIGSGSAAILLTHRRSSRTDNRLLGGVVRANSDQCHLCQGDHQADAQARPWMATDSEELLRQGVATAAAALPDLLAELDWAADRIDRAFCHQVGRAHQKLLFETLGLDPSIDFPTLEQLGNTGSVALPMTAAMGIEQGCLSEGDNVAMLGIGSGINVVMLGVQWNRTLEEKQSRLHAPRAEASSRGARSLP